MKYFLIPEDLVQSIREYLLNQPAREVLQGIISLDSLQEYHEILEKQPVEDGDKNI